MGRVSNIYRSEEPLWADQVYPNRVDVDWAAAQHNVSFPQVGLASLESLRVSANRQGSPVLEMDVLPLASSGAATTDAGNERILGLEGSLDAVGRAIARREQTQLRNRLLAGRSGAPCAICGARLPVDLLRASHKKRRSESRREERLDIDNVMLNCVLGCDVLYEQGYISVADDGSMLLGSADNDSLRQVLDRLAGRSVQATGLQYFEWHRDNVFRGKREWST